MSVLNLKFRVGDVVLTKWSGGHYINRVTHVGISYAYTQVRCLYHRWGSQLGTSLHYDFERVSRLLDEEEKGRIL
jgi:hypothetical protein